MKEEWEGLHEATVMFKTLRQNVADLGKKNVNPSLKSSP